MFEIRGETKRHFGAFGLARAARGTAHPTVVGGVAPSLGAPHKHTHGWCSLEPVAGVRGGESQPTCTGHGWNHGFIAGYLAFAVSVSGIPIFPVIISAGVYALASV